ncbi:MAG: AMP-binding protein [Solirubrobacterales bacterium]|nr:AMP-binding protein [Solirubrobacterales bacterium]MCB8970252.1 AMP-binding protein [Thermoleophilales bacterium]MCO5327844.1 AMP-binding protein [Solirubrobacterales bacterium]
MSEIPTDWLDHSARVHPRRVALADAREEITYLELQRRARAVASELALRGIGSGDPVAIDLPAGIPHAVALHGAILAGAVAQSLPATGREGVDVAPGARYVEAATVERALKRDGTWPSIRRPPRKPLTRVLSSGTSGAPKAVELTQANHLWSALASGLKLGVEPGDRWLCCLPLNHVGGLTILLRSALYGTAAEIHEGFDPERVASAFAGGAVTIASLVPTQLVRLLDIGAAVERPRLLLVGGGPLPLDVLAEAQARGARVVQTYGLTEACSQVCTLAPGEAQEHPGSAGRPLLGIEVAVEAGEIRVRGPNVAPGAKAADGWLHTGDLGRMDEDGFLYLEGRRGDLIVSGGENVRPVRVEDALRSHPGVADAGVVGEDDREWGQRVVAHVVTAPGAEVSEEELLDHARGSLARHEVPKQVRFREELPRTASGKLQRRLL